MSLFSSTKAYSFYCFVLFSLTLPSEWAKRWQQHEAPFVLWRITPKSDNGIQTAYILAWHDSHVYSISMNGEIKWSFDFKGMPSQLVCADLEDNGKQEVIVSSS